MQDQETEITLGTGRLLALFFGLVVICALFFSAGFSLGRKSAPPQLTSAEPMPAPVMSPSGKPVASKGAKSDAQASTSDEMTFYKAVEQNDSQPQLEPRAATPPAETPESPAASSKPAEMAKTAPLGTGYIVQIAAVSKQEDADALVNALRKKQYPVFTATVPTDKLFHVQVGPFSDIKDADSIKAKLVSDGYNPIVKR